jgi:hypothetical protein
VKFDPDSTLAVEPRPDCAKSVSDWPRPHILEAVAGRVRILNDTPIVKNISRHEHFCQVRLTQTLDPKENTPLSLSILCHMSPLNLLHPHILLV